MSSHYIIRDDQAPALFIYEAAAMDDNMILAFLEWNPTVVAEESALSFILHHQVKIDAIILNQMTETDVDDLIGFQRPYHYFEPSDFPEQLIDYLLSKGIKALDLIGTFDSRSIKLADILEQHFEVYIYSEHTKYIHLRNGHFKKWSSPGRGFRIIKPTTNALVTTQNLEDQGDGTFKVIQEGQIHVEANCAIWIGEII